MLAIAPQQLTIAAFAGFEFDHGATDGRFAEIEWGAIAAGAAAQHHETGLRCARDADGEIGPKSCKRRCQFLTCRPREDFHRQ